MVSAATPGSSGLPRASASLPAGTTTADGTPAYGSAPPSSRAWAAAWMAANSTPATSIDLVDTAVSRSPVTHREYRSIATVSSACTHRQVTGSIANTSSRLVSNTTYSPGRGRPQPPVGALRPVHDRPLALRAAGDRVGAPIQLPPPLIPGRP